MPGPFPFVLLNVRCLKRHDIDISYEKLIKNNALFLTETQVSRTNDVSVMQSILVEYTIDDNISSFMYSILAIW